MSTELQKLTLIEKELKFGEWCKINCIKRFLFDLDDTICPTKLLVRNVISQTCDFLAANAPIMPQNEWVTEVENINNRLFEERGISPDRWNDIVDELAKNHHMESEISKETKRMFQTIYTTPLTMLDKAEDGLKFVKSVVPIGVVTHADWKWTRNKYNWLGLGRFMDLDEIFTVSDKHKTSESWRQGIRYYNLKPEECAVVGDSPRTDINAAWEVGVRHCFLINDPTRWSVHNQPVDSSVKVINNLAQIPDVVLGSI